jgi:hypothetical protein
VSGSGTGERGAFVAAAWPAASPVEFEEGHLLGGPEERLDGVVSLGVSGADLLTADWPGLDASIAHRIASEASTYRYFLLLLTCTFRPQGARVLEANLSMQLSAGSADEKDSEDGNEKVPIFWSVQPQKVGYTAQRQVGLHFAPDLKLLGIGSPVSADATSAFPAQVNTVIGTGQLQSTAEWFFFGRPGNRLEGDYPLAAIVRAATGQALRARLRLGIEARVGLRTVSHEARLPEGTASLFWSA